MKARSVNDEENCKDECQALLAHLLRFGDRSRFGAPRLRYGQGCLSRKDFENVKGRVGRWPSKRRRPGKCWEKVRLRR